MAFFKDIQTKAEREGIRPFTKKSVDWFFKNLKGLRSDDGLIRKSLLRDKTIKKKNAPLVGRMFMYVYDPKGKEDMSHYDRFPLILMLGPAEKGFTALNLHYLSPRDRAKFFDRLMMYSTSKTLNENTKLRLTYDMLAGSAKMAAYAPCFKRYLFSQIKTKVIEIDPEFWQIALFLPSDSFVGKTRQKIWAENNKLI